MAKKVKRAKSKPKKKRAGPKNRAAKKLPRKAAAKKSPRKATAKKSPRKATAKKSLRKATAKKSLRKAIRKPRKAAPKKAVLKPAPALPGPPAAVPYSPPRARLPGGLVDYSGVELAATRPMLDKIRAVYERYGFEPLETPAIEYTDALGKFLPDQDRPNEGVFSFQDDDEQWLSLRYDLTAPLARYVAE